MPSTFLGLVLYTTFLLPGYVSYATRRRLSPTRRLSGLVETVTLLGTSVVTNIVVLGLFSIARLWFSHHTPDLARWNAIGKSYSDDRIGYLAIWGCALLAISCSIAFAGASLSRIGSVARRFSPIIIDVSAWYSQFEESPQSPNGERWYPYVACMLEDDSYVAGRLAWYSTEVDETENRELSLAEPVTIISSSGIPFGPVERVVVSARRIKWLSVSWLLD